MLNTSENLSFILVFLEGIISFFSPCILPLIPMYISYLSSNAKERREDGTIAYKQGKVFLYTLCFILGISMSFLILGFGFTALGTYFKEHRDIIAKLGGILIVLFGFIQLGIFKIPFLNKERRMNFTNRFHEVTYPFAFLLGFVFSFAWTPCVGPALSSVLILAGNSSHISISIAYILIYAIGFLLPFIALGLFTTQILNLLKKHQNIVKYTIKAGGLILIIMGVMMFMGRFNVQETDVPYEEEQKEETSNTAKQTAYDFTVIDQYGTTHQLSDYKGKVVFLNFWATWCGYCKQELPYIEEVYQDVKENNQDVIILSVVMPGGREQNKEGIEEFIKENNITFPVLFDDGKMFQRYYVSSLPTTFMIDREGNIFGYLSGALTKDSIYDIIQQTSDGVRK